MTTTADIIDSIASALYVGGWRSEDKEELITECGLTEEIAKDICDRLQDMASDK